MKIIAKSLRPSNVASFVFWINVIKVRLDFTVSSNGELNFINVNVGNCSLVRFAEKYLHGALELRVISFSGRRYC